MGAAGRRWRNVAPIDYKPASGAVVPAVAFGRAVEAAGIGVGLLLRAGPARVLLVARFLLAVAGAVVGLGWILGHGQFPSSNTTSRLAPSVVSLGDNWADSMRAAVAFTFIIVTGVWMLPPSLMPPILCTCWPR